MSQNKLTDMTTRTSIQNELIDAHITSLAATKSLIDSFKESFGEFVRHHLHSVTSRGAFNEVARMNSEIATMQLAQQTEAETFHRLMQALLK